MSVMEAAIRKLDKDEQARMAKLSLAGVKFAICESDIADVRNRPRFQCTQYSYTWVDSSLSWLVAIAWTERTKRG